MAKGTSKSAAEGLEGQEDSPVNIDELEDATFGAERRVLEIQTKLHRWARDDPHRRFDDLFNLVADPAFLLVAWVRVRGNKGAKTAGVDGQTAVLRRGWAGCRGFPRRAAVAVEGPQLPPLPVRERMIPEDETASCVVWGSPPSPTGWSRRP